MHEGLLVVQAKVQQGIRRALARLWATKIEDSVAWRKLVCVGVHGL